MSAFKRAARHDVLLRRMHYSHADDELAIESVQDVEPIFKANQFLANSGTNGWTASRDLRHVASIPFIAAEKWMTEGINIFDPSYAGAVAQKLNDPSNRKMRTGGGKVSNRLFTRMI